MPSGVAVFHAGGPVSPWRTMLAGLCAGLVGLGLARFAYTPLIPALIEAGWFSASEAVYLGAANLAGYLTGALLAHRMTLRAPPAAVLRAMMTLAAATFFAGASPLSFAWFFLWRFASGYAGGVLMVLGPSTVLLSVPAPWRGQAGGMIFAGVGVGIAASGSLVPLLMRLGLVETWVALGALSLLLALVTWRSWPAGAPRIAPGPKPSDRPRSLVLTAFHVEYGLIAVALVPHMVFWVDFIARGLGRGLDAGAGFWVLFGLSAALGPVLIGHVADRVGVARALRAAFVIVAACVALPVLADDDAALVVSSIVVGAFVPGVAGLAVSRVYELAPADGTSRTAAWGICTTSFAVGQAVAAYGFSFLFAHVGEYAMLFGLGASALVLALAVDLITAVVDRRLDRVEART